MPEKHKQHLSEDALLKEVRQDAPDSFSAAFPLLLTIPQAAVALSLSRAKVYQLIQQGELPVVRIDRSVRISRQSLLMWIQQREQGSENLVNSQNVFLATPFRQQQSGNP